LWAKVATLAARDPVAKLDQARAHIARREWKEAVPCYAEMMELEPTDNGEIWFEYAAAQLLAGGQAGYPKTGTPMLTRWQTVQKMHYVTARACTLAPGSTDDPMQPLSVLVKELEANEERNPADYWALTERGVLCFRTGRPGDAVSFFERSLAADG